MTFLLKDPSPVVIVDIRRRPRVRFRREDTTKVPRSSLEHMYPRADRAAGWIAENIAMAPMPGLKWMTVGLSDNGSVNLIARFAVHAREDTAEAREGELIDVRFGYTISGMMLEHADAAHVQGYIQRAVYELLLRAVRHELDECFHVGGVRVKDPHELDAKINVLPPADGPPIK